MIVASMRTQYGLSLYGQEFYAMKWPEFKALISGLSAETPLGRIIQIRSETNPDIIKDFTPGQKRIHDEWQKRMAESVTEDQMNQFLDEMKRFFVAAGS